jgi:peptidoglycan/LPS O-acetylase OafA/YrhL
MPPAKPRSSQSVGHLQFASIQYLRGLAAIMIVLYHTRGPLIRLGYGSGAGYGMAAGTRWSGLLSGVDIFFVISGFVMWVSTRGRGLSPLEFYRKRIVRIVPLYWAMTGVVLLILLIFPAMVQSGRLVASHVLASFFFLPSVHPVTGLIQPLLIPGWTLNEEMYFYAVFGCCLLLPAAARIPAAWLVLLAPVVLAHTLAAPDTAMQFFGNGIVLDFGLGLACGGAVTSGLHLPLMAALAMLVAGIVLLGALRPHSPHVLTTGLPALAVVTGLVGVELAGRLPAAPWLRLLGDASYSIYLSHTIALSALDQIGVRLGVRVATLGAAAGVEVPMVLITVAAGVLVYRWVEQPLTSLLRSSRTAALAERRRA